MSMLLIEIPLAILAFRRGWRRAPAGLLALPFLVLAFESGIAALLLPIVDGYFDPAGTARALSHGSALFGLLLASLHGSVRAADDRACAGPRQTAPHGAPLPDLTICQIPGSGGRLASVSPEAAMAQRLGYPVYDADNHLYETEEAMTAHLPRKWKKEFRYVEVDGPQEARDRRRDLGLHPEPDLRRAGGAGRAREVVPRHEHRRAHAARALREADRLRAGLSQRRGSAEADGRAGRPRHAGLPDARFRGRGAHELRPRADERRDPLAQHVDARGVGLFARGAPLRGAVRDADGRGHGGGRAGVGARARRAHDRRASGARARLPRQPLLRPARVRSVLGARAGGGHLRLDARLGLGLRPLSCACGRVARSSWPSCRRRSSNASPSPTARSPIRSRRWSATASSTAFPACASRASRTAASGSAGCSSASSTRTARCRRTSGGTRSRPSGATSGWPRSTRSRSPSWRSGSASARCCSAPTIRTPRASPTRSASWTS